eukprot:TRINITY_DN10617_c0_g5_i1.p1 TRINITY_DN10617_c0_g5~~TRINITY_DN10617_c0_g5_i1.p1  ORF type:complete len:418 (+),score=84.43 TRINITY_DN10617_c0_g5_i1:240-1493(+)
MNNGICLPHLLIDLHNQTPKQPVPWKAAGEMVDKQLLKLVAFLSVMIVGSIAVIVHIHLHDLAMPCTFPQDPNAALLNNPPQPIDLAFCTAVSRIQNALSYNIGKPTVIAAFPLFITTYLIVILEILAHLRSFQISASSRVNLLFKILFLGGFCSIAMVIGQLYGIFVVFPLFWFPVYMLLWKPPSQRQNRTFTDFQVGYVAVTFIVILLAQYAAYSPQVQGSSFQAKVLVFFLFAPAIPCFLAALQEIYIFSTVKSDQLIRTDLDEEGKVLQLETLLLFFSPYFVIGFVTHWIAMIWVATIPNGYAQLVTVFIAVPDFTMVWSHLFLVNYFVLMGSWLIWGVWEIGFKDSLYLIVAGAVFSPTSLVVGFYILRQLSFQRRQDEMDIRYIWKELVVIIRARMSQKEERKIDKSSVRL